MKKRCDITCIFLSLALSGCALLPQEEEGRTIALVADQETPNYSVEAVEYRDLQNTETLYATYGYVGDENYYFGTSGVLSNVYVSQGDTVSKGQLLACLSTYEEAQTDVDTYTSEIESLTEEKEDLETQMEFAQRRIDILYRYGDLTAEEYEEQMSAVDEQYADRLKEIEDELYIDNLRLTEAEETVENSAIFAERDGAVAYALSVAAPSVDDMDIYVAQYGREIAQEQMEFMTNRVNSITEDTVAITLAEQAECAFVCETEYTDLFSVGDLTTIVTGGTTEISVEVTNIFDGTVVFTPVEDALLLELGLIGRYTLVIDSSEDVLSISRTSLHESDDGYYVYYVDDDGLRQMKYVEVGVIGNVYAEIVSGLEEGDVIITR